MFSEVHRHPSPSEYDQVKEETQITKKKVNYEQFSLVKTFQLWTHVDPIFHSDTNANYSFLANLNELPMKQGTTRRGKITHFV